MWSPRFGRPSAGDRPGVVEHRQRWPHRSGVMAGDEQPTWTSEAQVRLGRVPAGVMRDTAPATGQEASAAARSVSCDRGFVGRQVSAVGPGLGPSHQRDDLDGRGSGKDGAGSCLRQGHGDQSHRSVRSAARACRDCPRTVDEAKRIWGVALVCQEYLTRSEVAALFGVSPHTITRWAREGRLPLLQTLGGQRATPERKWAA